VTRFVTLLSKPEQAKRTQPTKRRTEPNTPNQAQPNPTRRTQHAEPNPNEPESEPEPNQKLEPESEPEPNQKLEPEKPDQTESEVISLARRTTRERVT
jgi:hypothetical protein